MHHRSDATMTVHAIDRIFPCTRTRKQRAHVSAMLENRPKGEVHNLQLQQMDSCLLMQHSCILQLWAGQVVSAASTCLAHSGKYNCAALVQLLIYRVDTSRQHHEGLPRGPPAPPTEVTQEAFNNSIRCNLLLSF